MTDNIMTLIDYIRKERLKRDLDFVREAAEYFGQELIEMEAEDVIFGDVPFTGKLYFTWPLSTDQLPVGRGEGEPLFSFGFGLIE